MGYTRLRSVRSDKIIRLKGRTEMVIKWKPLPESKRGKRYEYQCTKCVAEGKETKVKTVIREPELHKANPHGPRKERITIECQRGHTDFVGWRKHGKKGKAAGTKTAAAA
jgi:hypothetical protein